MRLKGAAPSPTLHINQPINRPLIESLPLPYPSLFLCSAAGQRTRADAIFLKEGVTSSSLFPLSSYAVQQVRDQEQTPSSSLLEQGKRRFLFLIPSLFLSSAAGNCSSIASLCRQMVLWHHSTKCTSWNCGQTT
jgi:hypothetical protein